MSEEDKFRKKLEERTVWLAAFAAEVVRRGPTPRGGYSRRQWDGVVQGEACEQADFAVKLFRTTLRREKETKR